MEYENRYNEYIDTDELKKAACQIAGEEETEERRIQKVLLLEAIGLLDDDCRFVILKQLKGYRSKEIAVMLQQKWQKHGIVRYNEDGQLVDPDEAYVNACAQCAKEALANKMDSY